MFNLLLWVAIAALVISVVSLLIAFAGLLRMLKQQPKVHQQSPLWHKAQQQSTTFSEVTAEQLIYTISLFTGLFVGIGSFNSFGTAGIIRGLLYGYSVGWLLSLIASQFKQQPSNESASTQSDHYQSYNYQSNRTDANLFKLQARLFTLVGNNRETARRLLIGAKINYPDRSDEWILEKVIYDLERDRR